MVFSSVSGYDFDDVQPRLAVAGERKSIFLLRPPQ
jgi:hypothetical protein